MPIKKGHIAAAVVLVLAGISGYAIYQKAQQGSSGQNGGKQGQQDSQGFVPPEINIEGDGKHQVPSFWMAPELPSGIPWEDGARILGSYVENEGKKRQITRQYLSAKSVQENAKSFELFLQERGWQIITKRLASQESYLSASLGESFISFGISGPGQYNASSTVDVTYVTVLP